MKIDLSDVTSEADLAAHDYPLAGTYHTRVDRANDDSEDSGKVIVDFEVLAGTTPEQKGKYHREYFATSEAAMKRLNKLALVTGLIQPGQTTEVVFGNAVGRELVIELIDHDYEKDGEKRTAVQISFLGMHSLTNKKFADVPRGKSLKPTADVQGNEGAVVNDDDFGDL